MSAASAQTFDLRDIGEEKELQPKLNALDNFLFKKAFKNPVGRYASTDEWEENFPVVGDEEKLNVASSLIDAARGEDDARALSAILAAYRDGADKEMIVPERNGPSLTVGGQPIGEGPVAPKRSRNDGILPMPRDPLVPSDGHAGKRSGLETNDRLGARIVANLATFRSCSGALVAYLDHVGDVDAKVAPWTRMIQRSLGVAALPPDDSCLDTN